MSSRPAPWLALAATLALAQGCASLGSGAPCAEAPPPVARAPADGRLALLTWNLHGLPFDDSVPARMEAVAREVRSRKPDVVLFQEAWLDVEASQLGCRLAADYERVPEPAGVRSGFLGIFGHRRGGLMAFVRRAGAWRIDERFAPEFSEYSQSAPWYRLSEMDGVAGKGVQRFAIGDGARRVVLLNTHVQAQYPGRGNPYNEVRRSQLDELLALARKPAGADAVLVAGDLNLREDEGPLYGALTAEVDDLTAPYRHKCGRCGTYVARSGADNWWLDYVTEVRGGAARVARLERIRNRGRDDPWSDHHGVWADLVFP